MAERKPALIHWPIVGAAGILAMLFIAGLLAGLDRLRESRVASEPVAMVSHSIPSSLAGDQNVRPTKIIESPIEEETAQLEPNAEEETPLAAEPNIRARVVAQQPPLAPVTETKEPAKASPVVVKRIQNRCDEDLRKLLLAVPEVKLALPATDEPFVIVPRKTNKPESPQGQPEPKSHLIPLALVQRPDLTGLPMRMGHDCQIGKEPAENLQAQSRKLRTLLAASIPNNGTIDTRPDAQVLRKKLEGDDILNTEWRRPEAIPCLTQILQAENKPLRLLLLDLLAEIKGPESSQALAQRALFDLSAEVRASAIQKLVDRPRDEVRPFLLEGLNYPWTPVVEHAAEALAALQDREGAATIRELLARFEPLAQAELALAQIKQPGVVREVVRINHLSNCQMCHARSMSQNDLVRGLVPSPGEPLPPPTTPYYGGNNGIFVRADVTYLKQDFSVPQPVEKPGPWPTMQRFDYLVRTRPIAATDNPRKPDEQVRQALLFALGELDPESKKTLTRVEARAVP